jgi:uncharacterized protein
MKHTIIVFFSLVTMLCSLKAQETRRFVGTWEGILNVGVELRLVFHIREGKAGALESTADSPDQSAFGIPCDETRVSGETITIEMKSLNASFTGKLMNDSTISGVFNQVAEVPLQLKKGGKPMERNRPQTPQPPFPYRSEDVEYDSRDKDFRLGATITVPPGNGPFPAALLITGSGPQNRDEEILGHKLFAVIADHLTKNGFVVLRVDDRGVGKSTGSFENATSADFADDVQAGIDYLIQRPEVDKKRIGLIGHSEGGMIAPMVATQRNDIDFLVLMAAPGISIPSLMAEQSAAIISSAGISGKAVNSYTQVYQNMIKEILATADTTTVIKKVTEAMQQWADTAGTETLTELGLDDANNREKTAEMLAKTMSSKWFRYFLAFDPALYLKKLNTKVLAINGSRDIQVIPGSNLAGISQAIKKSKVRVFESKQLEGLNHLFQVCKKCSIEEYGILEETISPLALQTISDWLQKHVK